MMRIDNINDIQTKCTGCMACVDICPVDCISSAVYDNGFNYSTIDTSRCISCGKCYSICPIETQSKNQEEQHLFAAFSKDPAVRMGGSSGGVFEVLAKHFLEQGYYICGAAFENTTLKHRIINAVDDLPPLLKSKYIQSDMKGIYNDIIKLLKNGEKVFYCGTPCQVSALINSVPTSLKSGLFTADIICHGVPSQKVFDDYIQTLEQKHSGQISDFSFRVKDNKYKHAHGYSYTVTKSGNSVTVNGVYTNSSFYNAFKNYLIFRDSCYDCQYATLKRVSDITLADFWGIEKYDFKANVDTGVSMIITNTERGLHTFKKNKDNIVCKEFPLTYGIDSNYCLTHSTKKPKNRDLIIEKIAKNGYAQTAKEHFNSNFFYRIYWLLPASVRTFVRKMRR